MATKKECTDFENIVLGGVLPYTAAFRGMTYSDYLREWLITLHSDTPFYRGYPWEICYQFGNNSWYTDKHTGLREQKDKFQNKALGKDKIFRGNVIWSDTPIFVAVRSSFYSVGERYYYNGNVLQTIADCQFVCRRDMLEMGSNFWCTIQKQGCEKVDLKPKVFYYESPSFELTVTENSPIREHLEMYVEPGTNQAFVAAYAIIINTDTGVPPLHLPEGLYRLRYGGYGRGSYLSDTVQDFRVRSVSELPQAKPGELHIDPPDHNEILDIR